MKILIMGYSGSGKSTLARQLGEIFDLPVFHLDQIHFLEDWKQKPYTAIISEMHQILSLEDWIIDGNYGNYLFQERLRDSDVILYLAMNRFRCFHRCLKRYRNNRGKTREDVAPGCIEKFDMEFVWWILHKQRSVQKRNSMHKRLAPHSKKVIYLKTPKQVEEMLNYLEERREVL